MGFNYRTWGNSWGDSWGDSWGGVPSGGDDGGATLLEWYRRRREEATPQRFKDKQPIKLPPIAVLMEALEDWT